MVLGLEAMTVQMGVRVDMGSGTVRLRNAVMGMGDFGWDWVILARWIEGGIGRMMVLRKY